MAVDRSDDLWVVGGFHTLPSRGVIVSSMATWPFAKIGIGAFGIRLTARGPFSRLIPTLQIPLDAIACLEQRRRPRFLRFAEKFRIRLSSDGSGRATLTVMRRDIPAVLRALADRGVDVRNS